MQVQNGYRRRFLHNRKETFLYLERNVYFDIPRRELKVIKKIPVLVQSVEYPKKGVESKQNLKPQPVYLSNIPRRELKVSSPRDLAISANGNIPRRELKVIIVLTTQTQTTISQEGSWKDPVLGDANTGKFISQEGSWKSTETVVFMNSSLTYPKKGVESGKPQ